MKAQGLHRRPRVFTERVWLRQKILEPANKDRTRFDRRSGLPFSAVAIENKKNIPNSCSRFHRSCAQPCQNLQRREKNLCDADEFFVAKFRNIFQQTRLKHTASAEAKIWLRGPNMKYWTQQLNFAVFCATQGCEISREIFDSWFSLTPQGFHLSALGQCSFLLLSDCKISCLPPHFNLKSSFSVV